MPRIPDVDRSTIPTRIDAALSAQEDRWGAPLANHLLYARRPTIFNGMRSMWAGLSASGLLEPGLIALVNLRVAALIGCPF